MENGYPTTVDDIDADWLTAAMADRHPGVVVESVEVRSRQDMTNSHALIARHLRRPRGGGPIGGTGHRVLQDAAGRRSP